MRLRLKDLQLLHGIFGNTIIQLFLKNCHSGSLLLFVEMEWSGMVEMASHATSCFNVNIWIVRGPVSCFVAVLLNDEQSLYKLFKTQAPLD